MPLCGLKKSAKQKRDPSPSYAAPLSAIEDKAKSVGVPDAVTEQVAGLQEKLESAQEKIQSLTKEKDELLSKVENLEQQIKDKAKGAAEGLGMSSLSSKIGSFGTDKVADINEAEKKIENEIIQQKATAEERLKFDEELKVANQKVEEFKTEAEDAKIKMEMKLNAAKDELNMEKKLRETLEEEKENLKREKDNFEATLAHTKKELELAKKESHIPRSPTKLPTDEWKSKIESAQAEFEKERALRIEKEKDITRLFNEKEQLAKEKADLANDFAKQMEEKMQEKATTGFSSVSSSFSSATSGFASGIEDKLSNTEMNFKNDLKKMEEEMSGLKQQLEDKKEANELLLSRLSAVTATQVMDDNPDVVDLNDPNRPQKLSEQFAQLYDDEWTDATEAIEQLPNTEDAPKILMKILTAVYTHCKESADNQISRIEEDIFLPPMENVQNGTENGTDILKSPTSSKSSLSKIPRFTSHKGRPALPNLGTEKKTVEMESNGKDKGTPKRVLSINRVKGEKFPEIPAVVKKGIKAYRKKVTKQVTPVIEREIINKLRTETDIGDKVIDACKSYISRCVELCWNMRVQDPAVVLSWNVPDNKAFSTDVYRAFTESGSQIDYVVWPAMYMYEDGPILTKGVAQGMESG